MKIQLKNFKHIKYIILTVTIGTILIWIESCGEKVKFKSSPHVTVSGIDNNSINTNNTNENNSIGQTSSSPKIETIKPLLPNIVKTFNLWQQKDFSTIINLSNNILSETILMSEDVTENSTTFTQIDRPTLTESFNSGSKSVLQTEEFKIEELGIVDILLLIDNSGSMVQELENLENKFASITTAFSSSNWRIAVMPGIRNITNNDDQECTKIKVVNKEDNIEKVKEAINYFKTNDNHGRQQIFRQIMTALSCQSPKWLRDNSDVAIIIVTDEDNCNYNDSNDTYNETCPEGTPGRSASDVLTSVYQNIINKDNTIKRTVKFYAFFEHPQYRQCTNAGIARQIRKLVDPDPNDTSFSNYQPTSSSIWEKICADDYGPKLIEISNNIDTNLSYRFDLANQVDINKNITVKVIKSDKSEITLNSADFKIINKSKTELNKTIEFNKNSLKNYIGAKIKLEYYNWAYPPYTTTFKLAQHLTDNQIADLSKIWVNYLPPNSPFFEKIDPTYYSVDPINKELKFVEGFLAEQFIFNVSYKDNKVPLQKTFCINENINNISRLQISKVFINNSVSNEHSINDKCITLSDSQLLDGSEIKIKYEIKTPKLRYNISSFTNIPTLDLSKLKVYKISSQGITELTNLSKSLDSIQINFDDFKKDEQLKVEYMLDNEVKDFELNLPDTIIADSLKIEPDMGCDINLSQKILNCNFKDQLSFKISYNYLERTPIKEFVISEISENDADKAKWVVLLDNNEFKDFVRIKNKIIINEDILKLHKEVMIKAIFNEN